MTWRVNQTDTRMGTAERTKVDTLAKRAMTGRDSPGDNGKFIAP